MTPQERKRFESNLREIDRTLERNQAASEIARSRVEKYRRTLIHSRAVAESARSELRKAGYLR
jgi:hypothetical protein